MTIPPNAGVISMRLDIPSKGRNQNRINVKVVVTEEDLPEMTSKLDQVLMYCLGKNADTMSQSSGTNKPDITNDQ